MEYTHELSELFNMIGDISEQDRVIKFWNGSRAIIQKGLWRDNLNPEISSWSQVVTQAEIIEISENVAERRDRKTGSSQPSSSTAMGNYKQKGQSTDRSARAVNFDSQKRAMGLIVIPLALLFPRIIEAKIILGKLPEEAPVNHQRRPVTTTVVHPKEPR